MGDTVDVGTLEEEIRLLYRQRTQVEFRLKNVAARERQHESRFQNVPPGVKRVRDEKGKQEEQEPPKKSRLLSTVAGSKKPIAVEHNEETQNPKEKKDATPTPVGLSSAIVSKSVGERPRHTAIAGKEDRVRSRKLFGTLVMGTLQKFKTDLTRKAESLHRRAEIEQKVESKVKEERETFFEDQRRKLSEEKQKELAAKDEIIKKLEQKEIELLNCKWQAHKQVLSGFSRTQANPPIYYKPRDVNQNQATEQPKEETNLAVEEDGKKEAEREVEKESENEEEQIKDDSKPETEEIKMESL